MRATGALYPQQKTAQLIYLRGGNKISFKSDKPGFNVLVIDKDGNEVSRGTYDSAGFDKVISELVEP